MMTLEQGRGSDRKGVRKRPAGIGNKGIMEMSKEMARVRLMRGLMDIAEEVLLEIQAT
jgi:hypothetical protein